MGNSTLTDHDMINRIYIEMVGLDGKSGQIKEHKDLQGDVKNLKKDTVTKTECKTVRNGFMSAKRNRWLVTKDIALIILAAAALIASAVVVV